MTLVIVGTGHVFHIAEPIRAVIERERPDVVALELDPARFHGLAQREAGTFDPEAARRNAPRLYRALARFQEDVASSLGADLGGEMIAAARAAQSLGSRIALIDQSAEHAVRRLWKEMRWTEKARMLGSGLVGWIPWRRKDAVEAEVARYQSDPVAYLEEVGRQYPTVKRILIDERNAHMARHLRGLAETHERVVAVVGDGHVDGLVQLLTELAPRTVRLAELRKGIAPLVEWRFGAGADRVGFSFDQESPEGTLRRPP